MPNLVTGKKYHHTNDFERVAALNDQVCREAGLSIIDRTQEPLAVSRTLAERKRAQKGAYVWKDDLRDQITQALQNSPDGQFKTFTAVLSQAGISAQLRGQTISYAFIDAEHKHRRARGKRLGDDYDRAGVLRRLQTHQALYVINQVTARTDIQLLVQETMTKQRPTSWTELQHQLEPTPLRLELDQSKQLTYHFTTQKSQTFTFTPTQLGGTDYELSTLQAAIRSNATQLAGQIKAARKRTRTTSPDQSTVTHLINFSQRQLERETDDHRDAREVLEQLQDRLRTTRTAIQASQRRFRRTLPAAEFKTFKTHYRARQPLGVALTSPLLSQLLGQLARQQAQAELKRQELQRQQERFYHQERSR